MRCKTIWRYIKDVVVGDESYVVECAFFMSLVVILAQRYRKVKERSGEDYIFCVESFNGAIVLRMGSEVEWAIS